MKKSDRNLLQERLHKLAQPSAKAEPAPDATDEISHLFGGNLQLPGQPAQSLPVSTPSSDTALSSSVAQTTQSSTTAQGRTPARSKKPARPAANLQQNSSAPGEIAPTRDFTKTANSIVRDALRNGLFRGKSKQLYDFLYSKTRGAIVPTKSAQITRGEIMAGSHIGSTHTLRDNLQHLRSVGLVSWSEKAGEQTGNIYSVFLPNEANLPFDLNGNPVQINSPEQLNCPDHSGQILPRPLRAESALSAQGSTAVNAATSGDPKTSFKTKEENFDDEAFAGLAETFREITTELTGKAPTATENAKWRELAEVLVAELRIAAGRTTVSNVPAFMAEHLRRRLWKMDKKQAAREGKELPDQAAPAMQKNPVECLDCNGSGWWYPNGTENGVAKCKHSKLNG